MTRRFLKLATIILLFSFPLQADEVFNVAKFGIAPLIWSDTVLTYDALWNRGCKERNPIVGLYINKPVVTLAVDMVLVWGCIKLGDKLYKIDKRLGWLFVGGIYLVQGYMLYQHWQIRR